MSFDVNEYSEIVKIIKKYAKNIERKQKWGFRLSFVVPPLGGIWGISVYPGKPFAA
jgi:hypothetical protein